MSALEFISAAIKNLNNNKIFKFISSIKLAVPLMVILGACVAYGTIVESNYNSEYASMLIYRSVWFGWLLILLWINIFCATLSRIPFRLHHTGFVITHIGLLTLLIGGYITNKQGIDGQLAIAEGQSGSSVVLPHLMIGYQLEGAPNPQMIKFRKTVSALSESDLSTINDQLNRIFVVKKYLPFAKVEKQYVEGVSGESSAAAVSFILKSGFFDVSEWLHTTTNPVMKLGPATLKIIQVSQLEKPSEFLNVQKVQKKKTSRPSQKIAKVSENSIAVSALDGDQKVQLIKIKDLEKKPIQIDGMTIKLVRLFKNATVAENKLVENSNGQGVNPAVELSVQKQGQTLREVVYAKFENFSLNKDGVFGHRFSYRSDEKELDQVEQTAHEVEETSATSDNAGNTVIFSVSPNQPGKARITLIKDNQVVMSEILAEGQNLQTPWMGMKIFLGSVRLHAVEKMTAQPINPEKAQQLPASAVLIGPGTSSNFEEFWLGEGDQKVVPLFGKTAAIYFGRQTVDLPFELTLKKFSKIDYPGTNTPLSFESLVEVGKTGISQKISMNEPLKLNGFTVYQASYSMNPGEPVFSIFSVNQDPGRSLKYGGSLILGLGIILITLMRSRLWKIYIQRKARHA